MKIIEIVATSEVFKSISCKTKHEGIKKFKSEYPEYRIISIDGKVLEEDY